MAGAILSQGSRLWGHAWRSCLVPVILALVVPAARAGMLTKHMPLDDVTGRAERIVYGRIAALRSGRDKSGVPATWVTVDVSDTLKGKRLRRFTFKQFGVAAPLPDGATTGIASMPSYRLGEEVVLFLHGRSTRGFRSPVGLGQGTYRVKGAGAAALVESDLATAPPRGLPEFLVEVRRKATTAR